MSFQGFDGRPVNGRSDNRPFLFAFSGELCTTGAVAVPSGRGVGVSNDAGL